MAYGYISSSNLDTRLENDKEVTREMSLVLTMFLVCPVIIFWDFSLWDFNQIELGRFPILPVYLLTATFMFMVLRVDLSGAFLTVLLGGLALPLFNAIAFSDIHGIIREFSKTYGLWFVNLSIILTATFFPLKVRVPYLGNAARYILYFLLAYVVAQLLLANYYNNFFLYNIFGPFGTHSEQSYLQWWTGSFFRATGPFYEPSALGRIAITLWIIATFEDRNWIGLTLIAATIVLLSGSVGSIVVFSLMSICLLVLRLKLKRTLSIFLVISMAAVLLFSFVPEYFSQIIVYLSERLATMFVARESSSYLRIGAAFHVLSNVLVEHPFGVALGLDELFVTGVETTKLFNGIAEITLYFGILSIAFWLGILVWCFVAFSQRNWQKVLLLTYVIMCTVVSGSWFQLQFNILLVLLLVGYRQIPLLATR